MKNVLFIFTATIFAGCGPQGLPVSDISSYQLDYYDYTKNRLPIEEKIVDGQCMLWLQPAIYAMFEEHDNEQDSINAKEKFIGALSACNDNLSDFIKHIELVRPVVYSIIYFGALDDNAHKKMQEAANLIEEMQSRQRNKSGICKSLKDCLKESVLESDTIRCLNDATEPAEKVLPKE